MITIPTREKINAEISLPGSKSITNRALVIGALAKGETELINRLECEDTSVMIHCLRDLGYTITATGDTLRVQGRGGFVPSHQARLNTLNSGTTMRFLTGLVALGEGTYILDGNPRMRERPIEDLLTGLRSLGVDARSLNKNGCPPVTVRAGGLPGGDCLLSGDTSSQFLSSLLLSSPYAARPVSIRIIGKLVSRPYIEMTIRMMSDFGVSIMKEDPRTFTIPAGQQYRGRRYTIEGDASSASYLFAAAAITGGSVTVSNLGQASIQGDARFVDILGALGAEVRKDYTRLTVSGQIKEGIEADLNTMPDMVPTLAVTALFARGKTVIKNVANLRYKESDRLRATATELRKIGGIIEELPDGLIIEGGELHGAEIETYNDHRIAMAFSLAGLRIPGIKIRNPDCVTKTFPNFFDTLLNL